MGFAALVLAALLGLSIGGAVPAGGEPEGLTTLVVRTRLVAAPGSRKLNNQAREKMFAGVVVMLDRIGAINFGAMLL